MIKRTNSWHTRSGGLTVVTMRIPVYWDVRPFSQSVLEESAATYIPASTLKMEAAESFKTFVTSYPSTCSCIQRDSNLQLYMLAYLNNTKLYVVFSINMYCHIFTLMGIICIIPFVF